MMNVLVYSFFHRRNKIQQLLNLHINTQDLLVYYFDKVGDFQ